MKATVQPEGEPSPAVYLRMLMAREGGSISVERFMQEALYHPRFGYYARRVGTVGRTGDFSTSATLHPALGRAVAAWALAHRAEVACRGRWHLIELGGGTGELAAGVLKSLGWLGKLGLHYHLVEVSEPLRAQQQARLHAAGRVTWHEEMPSALAAAAGRALIFSNEFVDAFPCVQLVYHEAASIWREVRLAWLESMDHPVETTGDWAGEVPAGWQVAPRDGQRVEIHRSYREWLKAWTMAWRVGRLLTIDYGDLFPALYHRQPHGTLRAYCRHQRLTGLEVYRRFGQQDLTADVNFTDLQAWGEAAGLENVGYQNQAAFLRRWLPDKMLRGTRDARLAFLLDPDGAGGAFKVLEQVCRR